MKDEMQRTSQASGFSFRLPFDYFVNRRSPQRDVRLLGQWLFVDRLLLIDRLRLCGHIVFRGAGDVTNLSAEPAEQAFAWKLIACIIQSTAPAAPLTSVF